MQIALQEGKLACEYIQDSDFLVKKLEAHEGFQEKPKLRTGKKWTEETKE